MKQLFFIPLLILILNSCNKERQTVLEGPEVLRIRVAGISNSPTLTQSKIALKSAQHIPNSTQKALQQPLIKNLKQLSLQISSTQEAIGMETKADIPSKRSLIASAGLLAATNSNGIEVMAQDISYRLLLYRKNADNYIFETSVDLTAGAVHEIPIVRGQEYAWYSYSYNTTQALAPLSDQNNPSVPSYIDRELLYDAGTFTHSNQGSYNLDITFRHQLARIGFRVNAQGLFAAITELNAKFISDISLHTGLFQLRQGQMSNLQTHSNLLTGDFITLSSPDSRGEIREAYYYSANPAALPEEFTVSIEDLSARYDDYTVEKLIGNQGTIPTAQEVTFTDFSPSAGTASTGNINLIHAGADVGGLLWAKGNLHYQAGSYRFRPSDLYTYFSAAIESNANFITSFGLTDYWFWMAETPTAVRSIWAQNKVDPCALVYPAGTWRVPTTGDFQVFTNRNANTYVTNIRRFSPNGGTTLYGEFYDRGKDPNDPETPIFRLKADGRWQPISNLLNYTNWALLWSSTERTNVSQTDGRRAYYFRFDTGNPQVNTIADNLNNRRYNIRCVRDKN